MSGTCLFKMPHKDCGSSDALQVYEDERGRITGYCYSCGTYVPDPVGGKTKREIKQLRKATVSKTPKQIREEMKFIDSLSCMDLKDRRLRRPTLDHFGVKIGLSTSDGKTPHFAYFPYTKRGKTVKYKVKVLVGGAVWSVGLDNEVDLFGWEQAVASGAKRLIVTEGEFDAVALTKILEMYTNERYRDYIPAVVSIPNGAASAAKDLTRLMPRIRKHFKEVALAFDDDKAGKVAVDAVCKSNPDVMVIELPCKDANACLAENYGKAAFKSVTFNTSYSENSKLVWGEQVHDEAKVPAEWGFSWPWEHVTRATKGIRLGETIYIGAGQKQGKSEIVNAVAAHLIKEHGWSVLLAKPEEANKKTYKMVAGKMCGKLFHDPDVPFNEKAYEKAGKQLNGKLAMIDLYQHLGYDSLKGSIYQAANQGVKAVFIDPVTNLVNGYTSSEQNSKLQEIVQDLAAVAKDLDIVIFIFCHLRNPDSGKPHELGGKVLSSQFAGSRAMARSCNLMFGLEGNRDPNISREERNTKTLVLLEDREFGNAGRYKLFWDYRTTMFNEIKE